jgi:hypothetical protein
MPEAGGRREKQQVIKKQQQAQILLLPSSPAGLEIYRKVVDRGGRPS